MKKALEDIKRIDQMDYKSLEKAMCKFHEEVGEFAREVNKSIGMKTHNETESQVRDNILEEMADTFQNLLLVASRFGFSIDDIENEIMRKNEVWIRKVIDK